MTDDYDDELKISPRKQKCPTYCSMFTCVINEKTGGKCRDECTKLDLTDSLICELCDADCSKERKMILLDTKYFDHMKTLKNKDATKKIDDIRVEYRVLEVRLEEIRDKFHSTPVWNSGVRKGLQQKSAKLKFEMQTYLDIMDKMGIKYEKKVEL